MRFRTLSLTLSVAVVAGSAHAQSIVAVLGIEREIASMESADGKRMPRTLVTAIIARLP